MCVCACASTSMPDWTYSCVKHRLRLFQIVGEMILCFPSSDNFLSVRKKKKRQEADMIASYLFPECKSGKRPLRFSSHPGGSDCSAHWLSVTVCSYCTTTDSVNQIVILKKCLKQRIKNSNNNIGNS